MRRCRARLGRPLAETPVVGRDSCKLRLVQPSHLQLPLLDPQVARELGVVAANLLDEPLSVLTADEDVDPVTEGAGRRKALCNDGVVSTCTNVTRVRAPYNSVLGGRNTK